MSKKYLCLDGVAYLWSKIKEYVNSKHPQPIEIQSLTLTISADAPVIDGKFNFNINPSEFNPIKRALAGGATECPFVIRELTYNQIANGVTSTYYYKDVYSTMKRMLASDPNIGSEAAAAYSFAYTFALDLPNLSNHTNEHLHLHNSDLASSLWFIETHATAYVGDSDIDRIFKIDNNL